MTTPSVLATDAYKFSMAQAGFPLRRETFYLSFRFGGFHCVPFDLAERTRSLVAGLRSTADDEAFAREHGYGLTDAMKAALAQTDALEIQAVPAGAWVYEREPILTELRQRMQAKSEALEFEAAARAYQLLLDTYPTFRDAPKIELEHVQVLIDQKELARAAKVREAMLAKYDNGSPWARANPEQEVREAALDAGVALSENLTGGVFVNQSAAFSDFHATGANPAANASLSDAAFVANRFRVVQRRAHA